MSNKKSVSQILVFIILIAIVIVGILVKINIDNNIIQINNFKYENLNINKEELNIFYLDVGQADSTFITINGCNMLIDSGNDQDGYYIWEFLKAQNISKIDYFILTHCDEDHIGGAYRIIEELEIGSIYMPNKENETKTYQKLLNTIENYNIKVDRSIKSSKEKQYPIGNAYWKVLSIDAKNDLNDSSMVVELSYKDTKYLFMGDATTTVEKMIEWDEVDVLKVAHHGSNSSTSQEFLNMVKPKYAIISVGLNNSSRHPDSEVIDRLQKNNIEVHRTDSEHTIWINSDGNIIKISTLEYSLDGTGRKQAIFFERKYLYAFFFASFRI
ncbi:MAG: MBL fold metallo-hydrolase [Clostridia bacterium]|nr:MBL fold metallo-hydrolase [Clostridia bacterium]